MCSYCKKKVQDFALTGTCTDCGYIFVVKFLLICHKSSGKFLVLGTQSQSIRRCFALAYFPSRISDPTPLNTASPIFCHSQHANCSVTDQLIAQIWNSFQETPVHKHILVTTPPILLDAVRLLLTELKSAQKLRFILQPYDPCLETFLMPGFALQW
jgi:protein gp37